VKDNPLRRRDVLKLAAAAAAAGAETACTPSRPGASPSVTDVASQLDPAAADAILAKLDARLAWIDQASLPDDVLPLSKIPRGPGFDEELARKRALVTKSIRSLYLTGRFLDMPDEMKVHPGVQSRLKAMQPEMDDAVLGMTDLLEQMTPADHRRVQNHLQKDELFGERLAATLERTARDDGLSFQRTFGLRSSILDLTRRMSAQSPGLVIDPVVSKVRRIEAHPRSDAEESRRLAARVGEQAFWAHQERLALLHDAWARRLGMQSAVASAGDVVPAPSASSAATAPPPPAPAPPPEPAPPPSTSNSTPGTRTMGTGGIIMGFGGGSAALGLLFAGISAATSSSGFAIAALVLGVTIGPILLTIGLIVLIVGAVIHANE
jgi:hypothetical protein